MTSDTKPPQRPAPRLRPVSDRDGQPASTRERGERRPPSPAQPWPQRRERAGHAERGDRREPPRRFGPRVLDPDAAFRLDSPASPDPQNGKRDERQDTRRGSADRSDWQAGPRRNRDQRGQTARSDDRHHQGYKGQKGQDNQHSGRNRRYGGDATEAPAPRRDGHPRPGSRQGFGPGRQDEARHSPPRSGYQSNQGDRDDGRERDHRADQPGRHDRAGRQGSQREAFGSRQASHDRARRFGDRRDGKPGRAPSPRIQGLEAGSLKGDGVLDFFCPCPRGLEAVLADELTALGARDVTVTHGGVACRGPLLLAYRINLEARLPSRVMLRLIEAPCPHEHALYRLCHDIRWEDWFSAQHTLRVDVVAIRSPLKSLNFATLRIKDAIVDRFRAHGGVRPSIDTRNPDVRIHAFLNADQLQLYLDLSGEPLFKRGWRSSQDRHVSAPLKENLAAGLLALAGWQPGQPLGDLFCGSGTIIIEAAQQLCQRAPGLDRTFGIEQLSIHQPATFDELLQGLRERSRTGIEQAPRNQLWASDLDPEAIELARDNLSLAGLPDDIVQFQVADAASVLPAVGVSGLDRQTGSQAAVTDQNNAMPGDAAADDSGSPATSTTDGTTLTTTTSPMGLIVSNPPYNERVEIPIKHWREIGRNLRENFGGWHVFLLTSDRGLPGQLGLRERHKTPLFNGAIECRLFDFEMRARGESASEHRHNG